MCYRERICELLIACLSISLRLVQDYFCLYKTYRFLFLALLLFTGKIDFKWMVVPIKRQDLRRKGIFFYQKRIIISLVKVFRILKSWTNYQYYHKSLTKFGLNEWCYCFKWLLCAYNERFYQTLLIINTKFSRNVKFESSMNFVRAK